ASVDAGVHLAGQARASEVVVALLRAALLASGDRTADAAHAVAVEVAAPAARVEQEVAGRARATGRAGVAVDDAVRRLDPGAARAIDADREDLSGGRGHAVPVEVALREDHPGEGAAAGGHRRRARGEVVAGGLLVGIGLIQHHRGDRV